VWALDNVVGLGEAAELASDIADGWAPVADFEVGSTALGLRMGWEASDSMIIEWEHELGVGAEVHLEQEQEGEKVVEMQLAVEEIGVIVEVEEIEVIVEVEEIAGVETLVVAENLLA